MIKNITAGEFIDDKLRLYSAHSNVRGIPFIGDGFKQAQRKAVWGMLKRGESADKDTVERISARAASDTDYAHGVGSLESTIVGLAQDFAGSNNMPIFEKFGQFGDRLSKKPSASRYIKTKLSHNFRQLFQKEDDLIFEHMTSNGMLVEPKYFIPVLPLVLINGAEGMGTGHSTYIMSYNPNEIRSAIYDVLNDRQLYAGQLTPWWNGFAGKTYREENGQVVIEGKYEIKEGKTPTIIVRELPVGIQSDQYKAHLDKLEDRGIIIDYDNLSDKNGFEFVIKVPRTTIAKSDEEIKKLFKLVSRETENLTVWNGDGVLTRYDCVENLLIDWVLWRVERYEERRQALIVKTANDISWAAMKIKFIKFYLKNSNYFRVTPTAELLKRLTEEGFVRHDELLGLPIRSLTLDKIEELERILADLKQELVRLEADDAVSMYKRELKELKLPEPTVVLSADAEPVKKSRRGRQTESA